MRRRIYQPMKIIGNIISIPFVIYLLTLSAVESGNITDSNLMYYLYISAFIGLIIGLNTMVIIDTKENYVSYGTMIFFRRKIKFSDIESYDSDVDTKYNDNGEASETYILNLYGSFGHRKIKFDNLSHMKTVASALSHM